VVAVPGDSPALVGVLKLVERAEGFLVVDEALACFPGQLDELVVEKGDSLAEILAWEALVLDELARL
jgi:hypothetical protein